MSRYNQSMFTGLIRYTGTLKERGADSLAVACPGLRPELAPGDSIAVNGACLTVTELTADGFRADLLAATREYTTLGILPAGRRLNLEPALRAGQAFGGHFVQGHVDGTVRLEGRQRLARGDWSLSCELPEWLKPGLLERGSVAVDGVSLTIQELTPDRFSVALIPTTWTETSLADVPVGSLVNVEGDMLVKAVRSAVEQLAQRTELTEERLHQWGYGG